MKLLALAALVMVTAGLANGADIEEEGFATTPESAEVEHARGRASS